MRGTLLAAVLVFVWGAPAFSAETSPPDCTRRDGADWQPRRGVTPTASLGYGATTSVYLSGGLIVGSKPARCNRCALGAISSGTLVEATLAVDGGKLSVGAARANPFFGGGAAKLSLERTWRQHGAVGPGNMYLGPEIQFGYMLCRLSGGVLWHVGGPSRKSVRWSWAVGIGF